MIFDFMIMLGGSAVACLVHRSSWGTRAVPTTGPRGLFRWSWALIAIAIAAFAIDSWVVHYRGSIFGWDWRIRYLETLPIWRALRWGLIGYAAAALVIVFSSPFRRRWIGSFLRDSSNANWLVGIGTVAALLLVFGNRWFDRLEAVETPNFTVRFASKQTSDTLRIEQGQFKQTVFSNLPGPSSRSFERADVGLNAIARRIGDDLSLLFGKAKGVAYDIRIHGSSGDKTTCEPTHSPGSNPDCNSVIDAQRRCSGRVLALLGERSVPRELGPMITAQINECAFLRLISELGLLDLDDALFTMVDAKYPRELLEPYLKQLGWAFRRLMDHAVTVTRDDKRPGDKPNCRSLDGPELREYLRIALFTRQRLRNDFRHLGLEDHWSDQEVRTGSVAQSLCAEQLANSRWAFVTAARLLLVTGDDYGALQLLTDRFHDRRRAEGRLIDLGDDINVHKLIAYVLVVSEPRQAAALREASLGTVQTRLDEVERLFGKSTLSPDTVRTLCESVRRFRKAMVGAQSEAAFYWLAAAERNGDALDTQHAYARATSIAKHLEGVGTPSHAYWSEKPEGASSDCRLRLDEFGDDEYLQMRDIFAYALLMSEVTANRPDASTIDMARYLAIKNRADFDGAQLPRKQKGELLPEDLLYFSDLRRLLDAHVKRATELASQR